MNVVTQPDGPRVAFFPDMFHEVDGVANTARQFDAFWAQLPSGSAKRTPIKIGNQRAGDICLALSIQ